MKQSDGVMIIFIRKARQQQQIFILIVYTFIQIQQINY